MSRNRVLPIAAALLLAGLICPVHSLWAQSFPCAAAMPNTFVNGTIADANQVNANFQLLLNCENANGKIALAGNTTFYMSPTGSDTGNTCRAATAPCATFSYLWGLLQSGYQFGPSSGTVTIQLANGSYSQTMVMSGVIPGQIASSSVVIQGNLATPSAVQVSGSPAFRFASSARATLQGIYVTSAGSHGVFATGNAQITLRTMEFGPVINNHIDAENGSLFFINGNYTISGGGGTHWFAESQGRIIVLNGGFENPPINPGPVITLTGTPAFAPGFAKARDIGLIYTRFVSFSGSATGVRYVINTNSVFDSDTAGVLTLPGNAAGTVATGGVYN